MTGKARGKEEEEEVECMTTVELAAKHSYCAARTGLVT